MMQRQIFQYLAIAAVFLGISSCDKGLAPLPPGQPSIEGSIHFVGTWPSHDSVKNLVLALIPNDPPYKVTDLLQGVANKTISYKLLNYRNSDTSYHYDLQPGHFGYLGVAQQFSDSIVRDWKIVGFAHDDLDSARRFDLSLGQQMRSVDILVNWDSLPRQPFVP